MMRKRSTSNAVSRHSLFGPPPILEGEDAAAYDELFGRVCAAVKPADVIDEIFVADVVVGMGGLALASLEIESAPSAGT
jgi:hypothetical protein